MDKEMRYQRLWRNKWLTAEATTIGEMAGALEAAAAELNAMQGRGITLDHSAGDMSGDYACLVTEDPAVARQFGFEEETADEDESPDPE